MVRFGGSIMLYSNSSCLRLLRTHSTNSAMARRREIVVMASKRMRQKRLTPPLYRRARADLNDHFSSFLISTTLPFDSFPFRFTAAIATTDRPDGIDSVIAPHSGHRSGDARRS